MTTKDKFEIIRNFIFYSGRPAGWAEEDYCNGAFNKEFNKITAGFIQLTGSLNRALQIIKFLQKERSAI